MLGVATLKENGFLMKPAQIPGAKLLGEAPRPYKADIRLRRRPCPPAVYPGIYINVYVYTHKNMSVYVYIYVYLLNVGFEVASKMCTG